MKRNSSRTLISIVKTDNMPGLCDYSLSMIIHSRHGLKWHPMSVRGARPGDARPERVCRAYIKGWVWCKIKSVEASGEIIRKKLNKCHRSKHTWPRARFRKIKVLAARFVTPCSSNPVSLRRNRTGSTIHTLGRCCLIIVGCIAKLLLFYFIILDLHPHSRVFFTSQHPYCLQHSQRVSLCRQRRHSSRNQETCVLHKAFLQSGFVTWGSFFHLWVLCPPATLACLSLLHRKRFGTGCSHPTCLYRK